MSHPAVIVYSRPGCHLCEQLIEQLAPLVRGRAELEVRNIDGHGPWQRQFGTRIPVVEIAGRIICEYHLNRDAVEAALSPRA
ncbi:MAG TPA: glutaredoxin family protein [Woeseiaceae bacterium]|nr:glutaredoxin family protein [Woeseiaceae bacterium]